MTSTVSKALRYIVAERDSFTCVLCDNHYSDMHHITPRSHGGKNNPHNLVSLCRTCHMTLHRELPLHPSWEKHGFTDRSEWIEEMTQRMTEYTADYYADEYSPIDHDRFTVYDPAPEDATAPDWDTLNDLLKRFRGQYWDKENHRWVTLLSDR